MSALASMFLQMSALPSQIAFLTSQTYLCMGQIDQIGLAILHFVRSIPLRGGARYSKLGGLNDPGSLRVGGSEGLDVLDHYHNVIH